MIGGVGFPGRQVKEGIAAVSAGRCEIKFIWGIWGCRCRAMGPKPAKPSFLLNLHPAGKHLLRKCSKAMRRKSCFELLRKDQ